ncbi:MAG: ATP-binding cassette domain-containing protein, partial [Lachnospiraceae bacterium]|nr:ATP-binding cassette domain-containing protein [Lachnospiraceae bacterium]
MEIQLKNLSKTYEKTVLDGLNYTFESGKLYVIKGVSGCGKTTLFNVIGGIDPEYEGEVIMPKKCRTAYIFQQSLLLSSLTVRENLLLIHPNQKKVESLSKALGIHDLLDRLPESLSGGERQRAAIVRALLTGPNILLADEPTASLDGKNAEAVTRMIAGLRTEERVILVATHDAYFDPYADEIIELDYGTLGAITKNERPERPVREEADCTTTEEKGGSGKPFGTELKYVWKKSRRFLKVKNLLLSAIFFFLILIAASVQNNISSEAVRITSRNKPINLLRIEQEQMHLFTDEDLKKMTFFDDYYAEEGDRTAYYLLPKEYSVLNLDGVLSYGAFPETENGILVNE